MRGGLLVLMAVASAFAGERGPQFRGMQTDAMGRSGTASIHSVSALFLNPAGLEGLEGNGVEASGGFGINRGLLEYSDWLTANSATLNHPDSLLNSIGSIENKWASISNAFVLQGHYHDIAVSAVKDVRYDVSLGKGAILPKLGAGILSDMQVAAGKGFAISPDWSAGFTLKYLDRQRFDDRLLGENDNQFYVVKDRWQQPTNSLAGKLDKIEVASEIAPHERGFGLNAGLDYRIAEGFTLGASILDLPTFLNGALLDPQFNAGASYATDFGWRSQSDLDGAYAGAYTGAFHYNLVLSLDWQAALTRFHPVNQGGQWRFPAASSDPAFKQWKTGVAFETWIYNRQVGFISAGLSDGYPSFGIRLGYILHAYYLYTSQEIGTYPGQESLSFHQFGVDLDF